MLLLKNCKIIPELTEGFNEKKADVLIEGKRIKEIMPSGTNVQADQVIDLEEKYLLPGFFDMHVHFSLSGGDTLIDNAKTPVQQAYDAVKFAQDSLKAGFTTIRDVGSYDNVAIELRNAINAGNFVGPTIYAAGRIVITTEAGNSFFSGLYHEADGPQEMWKAVRQEMQEGADYIKILGTGAVMHPHGEPGQPIFTYEELKAVVDAAKFKDTYVASHCHGVRAIKESIRAGVRTIEHASFLDDEAIEMLKGNTDTYVVPTLKIISGIVESVPASSTFMVAKAQHVLDELKINMRKAYDAGLILGFGTDSGAVPLLHGANGDEFVLRKEFWDMKEVDIIKQATINSAIIMGVDADYGSIKAGKYADLVIVDGDPTADISVLTKKIDGVIKFGQLVTI